MGHNSADGNSIGKGDRLADTDFYFLLLPSLWPTRSHRVQANQLLGTSFWEAHIPRQGNGTAIATAMPKLPQEGFPQGA